MPINISLSINPRVNAKQCYRVLIFAMKTAGIHGNATSKIGASSRQACTCDIPSVSEWRVAGVTGVRREFRVAKAGPWACSMSPGGLRRTPLEKRGGAPARAQPWSGTEDSVNTSPERGPQIPDSQIAPRTALRNDARRTRRQLPENQLDLTEIFQSLEGPRLQTPAKQRCYVRWHWPIQRTRYQFKSPYGSRPFHALSSLLIKRQRFPLLWWKLSQVISEMSVGCVFRDGRAECDVKGKQESRPARGHARPSPALPPRGIDLHNLRLPPPRPPRLPAATLAANRVQGWSAGGRNITFSENP